MAPPPSDLTQIRLRPTNRSLAHPEWALVLGGASDVWYDLSMWEYGTFGRPWEGLIVAANDIGCHWPRPLDHWVTMHAEKLEGWKKTRAEKSYPRPYATWGRLRHSALVDYHIRPWAAGSTGMLAVQIALMLGCQRVVICGMPMTATPHFVESGEFPVNSAWEEAHLHHDAWERSTKYFDDHVRSMSGWTRELLGSPTRTWLEG